MVSSLCIWRVPRAILLAALIFALVAAPAAFAQDINPIPAIPGGVGYPTPVEVGDSLMNVSLLTANSSNP